MKAIFNRNYLPEFKIKNLNDIKKSLIFSIIFIFVIISVSAGTILMLSQLKLFEKKQKIESQNSLSKNSTLLIRTPVFISYLNLGFETSDNIYQNLLAKLLVRHEITPFFYSCLNQRLNNISECKRFLDLYFSNKYAVNTLSGSKIIPACENNYLYNFQSDNEFVNFIANKRIKSGLELKKTNDPIFYFYFIFVPAFSLFGFWVWMKFKKDLNRFLDFPLKRITSAIKNNEKIIIENNDIEEIKYLGRQIESWRTNFKTLQKEKSALKIAKLAAQAAHDIRSPLAALDMFAKNIHKIPEEQRNNIRNAINRINDIANNLLNAYKKTDAQAMHENILLSEPIYLILDSIVSEKRSQYLNKKNIRIDLICEKNTFFDCAYINASEFKRVLSNLINNAVEAAENDKLEVILIKLEKNIDLIIIKIIDTGQGICKDLLPEIIKGGFSVNKKNGTGLGVSYAVKRIKNWGGNYKINTALNKGTEFIMTLPVSCPPLWFLDKLHLKSQTCIFILDDDEFIHKVWEEKFKNTIVKSFYSAERFISYIKNIKNTKKEMPENFNLKNAVFLIDYELCGSPLTGLEIIQQLNIALYSILVTHCYDNPFVRKQCEKAGVKILPKNYAAYVPVNISDDNRMLSKAQFEKPDLILIDDNKILTDAWRLAAEIYQKQIIVFNTIHQADIMIKNYDFITPVYIDSDLGSYLKGEEYAKILYEQGFKNIYLTTGRESSHFKSMYWIKAIVGKDPIFN